MARKTMRQPGREIMERTHNDIIRRYHTLCRQLGLKDYEREALLSPYGVTSSKDMDTHDLIDVCGYLSKLLDSNGTQGELDKLRKRVLASIAAWLRAEGRPHNAEYIKGIACRVTGYRTFNAIPRERLRNLISLAINKREDKTRLMEAISSPVRTSRHAVHIISGNQEHQGEA